MLNIGGNAGKIYLGSNEIGKAYLGATQVYNSSDNRFIITVKTDNAGTSASNQFTIPTNTTGNTIAYNYDVETSDGYTVTGLTGDHTITFPSGAGTYQVFISGDFPKIYFNSTGDRNKLLSVDQWGNYGLGSTSQHSAFRGCQQMDILATDMGRFENVTEFGIAGSNFNGTFRFNSNITRMSLIDVSSAVTFRTTWQNNSSLTDFPANFFDGCLATDFYLAFLSTNLTQTSIDNILISIDTAGQSNGTFFQSGGQAPSATGEAAIDSLVGKGWTITVTGGYTP